MASYPPSALLGDPDFLALYKSTLPSQQWLQGLTTGANIANMGGRTALGLMIGTGLGNWLGNKFWNYQKDRDDKWKYGTKSPVVQAAADKLLGNKFDLGYSPPKSYEFPATQAGRWAGAGTFEPNWKAQTVNALFPTDWQSNPTLSRQRLAVPTWQIPDSPWTYNIYSG